jgi:hypothetical protein
MFRKLLFVTTILLVTSQMVNANMVVTISTLKGEVKIRKGLNENWNKAQKGMILEDIDTIMTGSDGETSLVLDNGKNFKLGANALLDIGDLRTILEQDLFLYLMSDKIDKLKPADKKAKVKIGNVSVVHGSSAEKDSVTENGNMNLLINREKNGAIALYENGFYPNAIVKMHKILNDHDQLKNCGELYFLMGKSFEAIDKKGQAIDHYKLAIKNYSTSNCDGLTYRDWYSDAEKALERLKLE